MHKNKRPQEILQEIEISDERSPHTTMKWVREFIIKQ